MKAKGLAVYVIVPASGKTDPNIKAGQMQLEVDQDGKKDPIATQVLDQGKPATIAGLTYTFQRTRQFTGLIVAHDPGVPFVWVGSALLVIGLYLVFFFPHRRIWVRVRKTAGGSEILCGSTMKRDVAFKPQFNAIITGIQLAGATPESTTQEMAHDQGGQNDA
jgi:cytochrome c biogenesis protein